MIAASSTVLRRGVLTATPPALVIALYVLLAGHNNPGGGFAAGLVLGAIAILRTIAGLARPRNALALVAGGVLGVTAVAAAPLLLGRALIDQRVGSIDVPLFGTLKASGALPFDIAVTAIVVGLILAVLDGLVPTESAGVPDPEEADR